VIGGAAPDIAEGDANGCLLAGVEVYVEVEALVGRGLEEEVDVAAGEA